MLRLSLQQKAANIQKKIKPATRCNQTNKAGHETFI